ILANSAGGNCVGDVPTDSGYNISSDSSCGFAGTSLSSTDPMLGSLDDNGGPTQTMALLAGPPAVNRIPPGDVGCGTDVDTDQRGVSRPFGSGCDVGAYEDRSVRVQLAHLLSIVARIGPGTSLGDKLKQILGLAAVANANPTVGGCGLISGFGAQVNAQAGKKISRAQAAAVASEAQDVES